MAIAFSAITGKTELRSPANPLFVAGNTFFTRQIQIVIPASTTVATLATGLMLPPGTQVLAAALDTDTSLATGTLALSTPDSIFVAAKVLTVVGGEQCTIAANKGVVSLTSNTADSEVSLALATASSPASIVTVTVTLHCALVAPVASSYTTQEG